MAATSRADIRKCTDADILGDMQDPLRPTDTYLDGAMLERHAALACGLIRRYWESLETRQVSSEIKPGDVYRSMPDTAPDIGLGGASFEESLRIIERDFLPALTHWQSPRFFAFFPANISTPAVIGELLSAGIGVQGMLWATSPACTEVEMRVTDWLASMIGLPESFHSTSRHGGGVIQGTASEAILAMLHAARHRARKRIGTPKSHLTSYASTQAHSSFIKAAMISGFASHPEDFEHVRLVETDDRHAMSAARLRELMLADAAQGRIPCFVCATLGTTSSGASDELESIADACDECARLTGVRPWVHVDAAWLGSAFILPEMRASLRGVERVDSFAFNPHKWMLVNFDCDCLFVQDRESLTDSMSVTPEYLRNAATESGDVTDYRDWHVPLGRRFRALKLWLVIRHFGVRGLQEYIRRHIEFACEFEALVRADSRFEVPCERSASLVCFALKQGDAASKSLIERVNTRRNIMLTQTVLPATTKSAKKFVLRMAVGAALTRREDVLRAWDEIRTCADEIQPNC